MQYALWSYEPDQLVRWLGSGRKEFGRVLRENPDLTVDVQWRGQSLAEAERESARLPWQKLAKV
jgi:hypothetical protein